MGFFNSSLVFCQISFFSWFMDMAPWLLYVIWKDFYPKKIKVFFWEFSSEAINTVKCVQSNALYVSLFILGSHMLPSLWVTSPFVYSLPFCIKILDHLFFSEKQTIIISLIIWNYRREKSHLITCNVQWEKKGCNKKKKKLVNLHQDREVYLRWSKNCVNSVSLSLKVRWFHSFKMLDYQGFWLVFVASYYYFDLLSSFWW